MSKKNRGSQSSKEVIASVKYVRVSPYKLRKVADAIRNMTPQDALYYLKNMSQKSSGILYKLIHSCIANAENNYKYEKSTLIISRLVVNEGPKLKRAQPRARGRMFKILKPYSHVEVAMVNQGVKNGSKS